MLEISAETILKNPVYTILLLVICCVLWQLVTFLFNKVAKVNDKQTDAIIVELKKVNDVLAEAVCDLRVSFEKISTHDSSIDWIEQKVDEHDRIITRHDEQLKTLVLAGQAGGNR